MDCRAAGILTTVVIILLGLLSLSIYLKITGDESKIKLENTDNSTKMKQDLERGKTSERLEIINRQFGPEGVMKSADVHIRLHSENLLHERKTLEEKHKHQIKLMASTIASTVVIVAGIIGAIALMRKRSAAAAAQAVQPPSAAHPPPAGAPRYQQEYII